MSDQIITPDDLRSQANRYEEIAGVLRAAAEKMDGLPTGHPAPPTRRHQPHGSGGVPKVSRPTNGTTRKEQVVSFLKKHGPSARASIVAGTKAPVGSIKGVLKDEKTFENKQGLWSLKKKPKPSAPKASTETEEGK
jgi:hypothetical protein